MDFLKFIDIFNFIIMSILLIIVVFRIFRFRKKDLLLWLPSIIVLSLVLYVEANEKSMISIYLIGMVALTYTIVSSTIVAYIDKNKKFSAYYSFGSIFLGLFTIFAIHFGGVVKSVLTMPLFYTLMLISISIIIIDPIILLAKNKLSISVMLGALGWIIIAFAIWSQWEMITGALFAKIMILVGILCLSGSFLFIDSASYKSNN